MALLGAGWALVACGLVFWGRHRGNAVGPLLVAAGFAWFLAEWDSPGVGSAPVFTVGLVFYASSAAPRGVGGPRVSDRSAGFARGTRCRWSRPGGRRTRARPPAGSRLRPGHVRLLAVRGQSPARRGRAGALRRSRATRHPLRPGLVAPVDRSRGLESGAFEPDEAACRRAGRPRRLRLPCPRRRDVRHEPPARVRRKRRARAPALARPGSHAHRARGRSRLAPAPGPPDALVARPARRRAGRVASTRTSAGGDRRDAGRPGPRNRIPHRRGPIRRRAWAPCRSRPRGRSCRDATRPRGPTPSRSSSIDPTCSTIRSSSRRSRRLRGSLSRTSASRPRRAHRSRISACRAPGSSKQATPSGAGSSAISTTGLSSVSSGSRSHCASCARSSEATEVSLPPASTRPRARSAVRSSSCETSRTASIRRCSPTKALPPQWRRLPKRPTSVSPSCRKSGSHRPSRPPPTSSSRRPRKRAPPSSSAERRDGVLVVEVETDAEPESLLELQDRIGALDGRLGVERAPRRWSQNPRRDPMRASRRRRFDDREGGAGAPPR